MPAARPTGRLTFTATVLLLLMYFLPRSRRRHTTQVNEALEGGLSDQLQIAAATDGVHLGYC